MTQKNLTMLLLAFGILTLISARPTWGYMVSKAITAPLPAGVFPVVVWNHFELVYTQDGPTGNGYAKERADYNPPMVLGGQFADFNPYSGIGFNRTTGGLLNIGKNGEIPVVRDSKNVPLGGLTDSKTVSLTANPPMFPSSATATSKVDVGPLVAGSAMGTVGVEGDSKAAKGGKAYAFSDSQLSVTGVGLAGNITVVPQITRLLRSTSGRELTRDPVVFEVTDHSTGQSLLQDALLNTLAVVNGAGSITWQMDRFTIDATDAEFHIDDNSPYILPTERGKLDLVISNGMIAQADATGIFSGVLPSIGQQGTFSIPLSNQITLNYNLGSFGGSNVDVALRSDDAGESLDLAPIPEPSTGLLLATGLAGLLTVGRRHR